MKHHLPAEFREHLRKTPPSLIILLAGVFVGTFLAGAISMAFWPKIYTASTSIEIQPIDEDEISPEMRKRFRSRRFLNTQADIIGSKNFLVKVAWENGLAQKWEASSSKTSSMLTRATTVKRRGNHIDIAFKSNRPKEAIEISNLIGQAYLHHWRNLHKDRYTEVYRQVEKDFEDFQADAAVKIAAFRLLNESEATEEDMEKARVELQALKEENAIFENSLSSIDREKTLVSSAARVTVPASMDTLDHGVNLHSGFLFVFFVSLLTTLSVGAVAYHRASRLVASIPEISRTVSGANLLLIPEKTGDFAQRNASFEKIKNRIMQLKPHPGVSVTLLPCQTEVDISPIACEMASSMALDGLSTILVEGNLKSPSIHTVFNAAQHPGISDFLRGEFDLQESVVKSSINNLWIMPGGAPCEDSRELLSEVRMNELLKELSERFDIVIINSPAIISSVDPLILIGKTDLTFLCCESGHAPKELLVRARKAILQSGGTFAGLVLNSVKSRAYQRYSAKQALGTR